MTNDIFGVIIDLVDIIFIMLYNYIQIGSDNFSNFNEKWVYEKIIGKRV